MAPKFVLLLMLLSPVVADQANPMEKVIELISSLEAKLMKEGEMAEKAYKEFFEWCDDAAKNTQFEIKTATAEKEKLEATIAKATSDIEDSSEQIDELATSISTNEADLKAATAIQKKENDDFVASEAEL